MRPREAEGALLLDLPWLDKCALLEPLREQEGFEALRRRVRLRGARLFG